jgi:hypothetical protein
MITIKDILADEAERVQKEYNQRMKQGGIGGVIVSSGEDMEVKPLSWSPKDLLGQEIRTWTKVQVLNAFGLNAALFENEGNRALIDGARYLAMLNAVLPRMRLIESAINHDLSPEFDERLIFIFENPVRDDTDSKVQQDVALLDRNVMTINEVRQRMGLEPVAWGNTPQEQSNRGSGAGFNPEKSKKKTLIEKWSEEDHPRGQPNNAGQFAPHGGGSSGNKHPLDSIGRKVSKKNPLKNVIKQQSKPYGHSQDSGMSYPEYFNVLDVGGHDWFYATGLDHHDDKNAQFFEPVRQRMENVMDEMLKSNFPQSLYDSQHTFTFVEQYSQTGAVAQALSETGQILVFGNASILDDGPVHFDSGTNDKYVNEPMSLLGIMAHEMGHSYAYRTFGTFVPKQWVEAHKHDDFVTENAEKRAHQYDEMADWLWNVVGMPTDIHLAEDFAEATRLYVIAPEKLKTKFPHKYKVLESFYSGDKNGK